MLIDSLADTTVHVIESVPGEGWGADDTHTVRDTKRVRFTTLSGGEQVAALNLGRVSTHRIYAREIDAHEGDEVVITDGDYAGTYRVRFVDLRQAAALRFLQMDLEYRGAYQGDIGILVTYEGEPVTFGGEAVVYA